MFANEYENYHFLAAFLLSLAPPAACFYILSKNVSGSFHLGLASFNIVCSHWSTEFISYIYWFFSYIFTFYAHIGLVNIDFNLFGFIYTFSFGLSLNAVDPDIKPPSL